MPLFLLEAVTSLERYQMDVYKKISRQRQLLLWCVTYLRLFVILPLLLFDAEELFLAKDDELELLAMTHDRE